MKKHISFSQNGVVCLFKTFVLGQNFVKDILLHLQCFPFYFKVICFCIVATCLVNVWGPTVCLQKCPFVSWCVKSSSTEKPREHKNSGAKDKCLWFSTSIFNGKQNSESCLATLLPAHYSPSLSLSTLSTLLLLTNCCPCRIFWQRNFGFGSSLSLSMRICDIARTHRDGKMPLALD